jgi:hypothetical protein
MDPPMTCPVTNAGEKRPAGDARKIRKIGRPMTSTSTR